MVANSFLVHACLELSELVVLFVEVVLLGAIGVSSGFDEFLELGVFLERLTRLISLLRDFLVAHEELGVVFFELLLGVLGDRCKFAIVRIIQVFAAGFFEGCLFAGVRLFFDGGLLIEQVLINLIKNANEAIESKKDGEVSVCVLNVNGQLSVVVSDNGTGITKEAMQKIFMPFYSTKNRGSGIGLSLSKQIMQLHGGDILLNSEIGKGSVLTLVF